MRKTIHIHLHSTPTRDAGNWEESKHPRAENGQFGKGSGGGAAAKKSAPAKKPAPSSRQAELREMGSPRATGHVKAPTQRQPGTMNMGNLKEGQALYDQKGQKVDHIESISKHPLGGWKIETRAGYSHRVDTSTGRNAHGLSNEPPVSASSAGKPGDIEHHKERADHHTKALADTSKTDAQLKEHAGAKWHHERAAEQMDLLKRMGPDSVAKESVQKTIKHHQDFAAKHEANLQQGEKSAAPASPREVYAEHRKEAGARGQEALDLAEKARNSTDPKVVEAAMNAIEKAHRAHSLAGQAARKIPYPGNSSPWEHHDERTAALSKLAESMHQRHFALTKGKGK